MLSLHTFTFFESVCSTTHQPRHAALTIVVETAAPRMIMYFMMSAVVAVFSSRSRPAPSMQVIPIVVARGV